MNRDSGLSTVLALVGLASCVATAPSAAAPPPPATARTYTIDLRVIDWTVRPGVVAALWAFSNTQNPATLPGPVIRANQGDLLRVVFRNTHIKPHTLHFHGFHPIAMDGILPVEPGREFVYEYVADPPGTYAYHCHINTPVHQDRGMLGQFIVDTPLEPRVDKEFLLVVDEVPRDWSSLGDDPTPQTHEYVINGKAYDPAAAGGNLDRSRMIVRSGEKVRLRVTNFGFSPHALRLDGHQLSVVQGSDPLGTPQPDPAPELVTNQSLNITFTAGAPGTYRLRSARPEDNTNGGTAPGGMQTELVVTN